MATESTTDRPLRADARRNREKILEAARAAFGEIGLDAQMDDIAERAGVGVGTVYRHFPTKETLVRALVVDHMAAMAEIGRRTLAEEPDAWKAFSGFLLACAEQKFTSNRGLSQVFATAPASAFRDAAESETDLRAVGAELLRNAQEAGEVRPDAVPDDIPVVMCGLAGVHESSWGPNAWRRYMAIALAGLRAREDEPSLPSAPNVRE